MSEQLTRQEITSALCLGWTVDKLARVAQDVDKSQGSSAARPTAALPDLELRTLGDLDAIERLDAGLWQIQTGLSQLPDRMHHLSDIQAARNNLKNTLDKLRREGDAISSDEYRNTIGTLHREFIASLGAQDNRLEKGYHLGFGLARLYREDDPHKRAELWRPESLRILYHALADLQGVLPKYAARVVSASLADTSGHVAHDSNDANSEALRLQGHRWRAILCGEMDVTDFLDYGGYYGAAKIYLTKLVKLARHAVKQFRFLLLALLVCGMLGIAATAVYFFLTAAATPTLISAVLSITAPFLAALRIVGPVFKSSVDKASPMIWENAIVDTVAPGLRGDPWQSGLK